MNGRGGGLCGLPAADQGDGNGRVSAPKRPPTSSLHLPPSGPVHLVRRHGAGHRNPGVHHRAAVWHKSPGETGKGEERGRERAGKHSPCLARRGHSRPTRPFPSLFLQLLPSPPTYDLDAAGVPVVRAPYHVRVVVPCYKESLDILRRTVLAARDGVLPAGVGRTIYLCDDGKARWRVTCELSTKRPVPASARPSCRSPPAHIAALPPHFTAYRTPRSASGWSPCRTRASCTCPGASDRLAK